MSSLRRLALATIVLGYLALAAGGIILVVELLSEHLQGAVDDEAVTSYVAHALAYLVIPLSFWMLMKVELTTPLPARYFRLAYVGFSVVAVLTFIEGLMRGLVYTSAPYGIAQFNWYEASYFIDAAGGFVLALGFALAAMSARVAVPMVGRAEPPAIHTGSDWHRENFS